MMSAVAVSGATANQASASRTWPRVWHEQEPLLERQHERLEARLDSLIQQHLQPEPPQQTHLGDLAAQRACRRLLWDLRLHLRLEERWLERCNALCSGHRSSHQAAASQALEQFNRSQSSHQARLDWLRQLQIWFNAHRRGTDAMAYGLARRRQPMRPTPLAR